jgi:Cu(I)/Ag(I) efflux system membrane fusion protein
MLVGQKWLLSLEISTPVVDESSTRFMHRKTVLFWIITLATTFAAGVGVERYLLPAQRVDAAAAEPVLHLHAHAETKYVCPMHPQIVSNKRGTCPICGMALVSAQSSDMDNQAAADLRPAIRITPEVINNLGVKLITVTRTTLRRRIETPGFVQDIQPAQHARVKATVDGQIRALHFKPEQWIEQGQPLFTMESESLRAAEAAHLTLLTSDEAPMPVESHAATSEQTTPAESPETMDQISTAVEQKPAKTLEESRQQLAGLGLSDDDIRQLEQQRKPSTRLTLHAPFAGSTSNIQVTEGQTVKAGTILFELGGLMRANVLANAFQRDAAWIQPGQPVEVSLPHVSNRTWPGIVNVGVVSIDPSSQNIGIRLSFTAPAALLKNAMYVVAMVYGDSHPGVLAIPTEALIRTEMENRVIVALGDGRFKPVRVRIGIETGNMVEITSGLKAGDQIVVSAQFLIDSESSLQASFRRMTAY